MLTKAEWRDRARTVRAAGDGDGAAHLEVMAHFLGSDLRRPGWVIGYRAMADEVDLGPLMERADLGPFAITRTPERGFSLTVHPADSPSERHRFGFDQPIADAAEIPDADIAAVLVPGLAFDRLGTRLGHGVGYYDRLLARMPPGIPLVGVTGGYVVAELPAEPHDIAMTHLAGAFGVLATPLSEPVD